MPQKENNSDIDPKSNGDSKANSIAFVAVVLTGVTMLTASILSHANLNSSVAEIRKAIPKDLAYPGRLQPIVGKQDFSILLTEQILFDHGEMNVHTKEIDQEKEHKAPWYKSYDGGHIKFNENAKFKKKPMVFITEYNDAGAWLIIKTDKVTKEGFNWAATDLFQRNQKSRFVWIAVGEN